MRTQARALLFLISDDLLKKGRCRRCRHLAGPYMLLVYTTINKATVAICLPLLTAVSHSLLVIRAVRRAHTTVVESYPPFQRSIHC